MYQDMIAYWAKQRPDSIAVMGAGALTYRAFDAAINQMARRLLTLDPPRTGLVALQQSNLYSLHLLERALDRMGLASVVLAPQTHPAELLALLRPALFLTDIEANVAAHPNGALVAFDWVMQAQQAPPCGPPGHEARGEDLLRVVVSSGTTGVPKMIPVTRASLARRIQVLGVSEGLGRDSRLMLPMGPQTISGLVVPNTIWALGAAVAIYDMRRAYAEILRLKPTYMLIAPGQLEALLREMPADAQPIAGLHVTAAGSQVSRSLAAQATARLTADFWILYGSTEHGTVTVGPASVLQRHERAVGHAAPTMAIQAVGEDGAPLPPGQMGVLRTRGDGIFPGYRDDEAMTAAAWRDGWFYPGDHGAVLEDGLVIVGGRIAETLNLGGVKIDPNGVDEVALACPGVRDAAAFSAPDELGIERPWIAVVRGEGFRTAALTDALQARWPALRHLKVAAIDAIPRNDMAKIERQRLKQMVIASLGRAKGDGPV